MKANIWFSLIFGGGSIYSSGEDSLFLKECFNKGLKMYTHNFFIGECSQDESTWFDGFNEKFFYDKGAWCAAAFPILKYFAAYKLAFRTRKLSNISFHKSLHFLFEGIKGFYYLRSYSEYTNGEK